MSIERVSFHSDQSLEGLLRPQSQKAGVVICHPHPLYGGNMYNNVVSAIEDGYAAQGFSTLIFNFRGVGSSQGEYDEVKARSGMQRQRTNIWRSTSVMTPG